MINTTKIKKTIGITGASGALGKELTKLFRQKGYEVIGFTHSKTDSEINLESPNKWIKWECGKESKLKKHLKEIDILILNHGIYNLSRDNSNYENSIEINALSKFKFLKLFEDIALTNDSLIKKEIWINTSEAEILPALNPSYDIEGRLVSSIHVASGFPMRTFFFSCKSILAIPRTIADLPLNGSHEPINNISLIISKINYQ